MTTEESEKVSLSEVLVNLQLQTIAEHDKETGHGNDYTYWYERDEYVCNRCGRIMRKSK